MKKINLLFTFVILAFVMVSCETYDDYNTDRKTIVGFSDLTKNINGVPKGKTKDSKANVFISDVSNVDRTFNVVVVPVTDPENNPPTAPENYTFDSKVVILANTRTAEVKITGVDVSLTKDRGYFALAIEAKGDVLVSGSVLVGLKL